MADDRELIRLDKRPIPRSRKEVRAFLAVRNESLRLPAVLDHHRRVGVDRFFIVDNASTDGTAEFLLTQTDVHLFSTASSFAQSHYSMDWLHPLLDAFGGDHWTLTIDADELFIYPHYEQLALRRFCEFLDRSGARGVLGVLLDMYSDRPIGQVRYRPGGSLTDACPYFDAGPYRLSRTSLFPPIDVVGGVRERVFWRRQTPTFTSPFLNKVPLVKWRPGLRYLSGTHRITPVPLSNLTSVLLHFKFLNDFHRRADEEVRRGEHYEGAREYTVYSSVMNEERALNLHYPGSVCFESSQQLMRLGLIKSSPAFDGLIHARTPGKHEASGTRSDA